MNKLPIEERAKILGLLCEGMSVRAVTRLTGASKNTVAKLLIDAGKACTAYHDVNVRNVKAARVQVDKIWSFTYPNQKKVAAAKAAPDHGGDTWTWTAIDADSRMIVSYLVGGRDAEYAMWFIDDLTSRLANRVRLTSGGHRAYREAVESAFGCDVNYARLVKMYGATATAPGRYSTAECTGIKKIRREGNPEIDQVSSSDVERQNLTMRGHTRRFTRPINAFSKKVENHAHTIALHMMYYNFVRVHKTLRVTPAMEAGVTDRLWDITDIAMLVEEAETKSGKRDPKRNGVNMAAENLSPAEVTELCTAGYDAWNQLGPRQKEAKFKWRGRSYVAKHTGFRLCVDNAAGEPVACRYD